MKYVVSDKFSSVTGAKGEPITATDGPQQQAAFGEAFDHYLAIGAITEEGKEKTKKETKKDQ
jgi:hypothetical protein